MKEPQRPEPSEETKTFATYIAIVIRNAVCTALHAFQRYPQSPRDKQFMDFQLMLIPKYWESPKLLDEYLKMWEAKQ